MKKLLLTLLLSTSFSAFSDSHVDIVSFFEMDKMDFTLSDFCYLQPNVQDRNGVYYFPNEEVGITATSICVYKEAYDQRASKGNLKNGKFDGKWTTLYENGQKKVEGKFKDDKRDGKWTHWEWNGLISKEANYKDGNGILTIYEYHDNGLISKEANYKDHVGLFFGSYLSEIYKKHGKETLWYKNGQIKSEKNYKDGECISGDC